MTKPYRTALLLSLLAVTLPVHAEYIPIVVLDSETCQIKGWHNLGGCFKNATGEKLMNNNLYLKQTISYTDKRTPIVGSYPLTNFHVDHYAIISSSSEIFTRNHIKNVTSEIALGSGTGGKPVNGCELFFTGEQTVTRVNLIKNGEDLSCTTG